MKVLNYNNIAIYFIYKRVAAVVDWVVGCWVAELVVVVDCGGLWWIVVDLYI